MFKKYLNEIFKKHKTGEASERTYYSVLEELLKNYKKESEIIVEARKSSIGIPDFKVQSKKNLLIGYLEAKDLGRDLDRLTKIEQDQIDKYKKEYPKLIVTNFIDFRLFENRQLVDSTVITQPITLKLGTPVLDNEGRIKGIFERFFSTTIRQVHTARRLSELLAHKTRVLRGLIREEIDLSDQEETETEKLLETFKKTLKPDMTPEVFSDMYAQTITFGMFVARINSDHHEFTRYSAYKLIPHTIPLLRAVFRLLSFEDAPQHIEWQVDEIAEILANTKIEKISEEFFSHGKGRDPIIHFYETFLTEYDPKQREQLGVYYTPPPVVSYITRSINKILKKSFDKKEGFADTSLISLDPAAGTLTFPAEAITLAKQEFESSHGTGGWNSLVKTHILKNFYAFEILMAPYAVGHLKISLLLKELGYQMHPDDRFKLYLTNTLDMSKFRPQQAILAEEISQESEKAFEIKDKLPVLVVMGNPPYSGVSSNMSEWIMNKIDDYREIDGESIKERKDWLNDDYVKFFRFAQWKIEKTGQGILGFITNHAWLDNPTFRGMRYSLMRSFNEIFILNLHGSTLKREKVPLEIQKKEKIDEKDEGVFGIRPGTAIILAIKNKKSSDRCKVYYSEQWGLQGKKFRWLESHDFENTDWLTIYPKDPFYFLVKKGEKGWDLYKTFISIKDIFPLNSTGIVTARDNFVIDFDKRSLEAKIRIFLDPNNSDEFIKEFLRGILERKKTDDVENYAWRVSEARTQLRNEKKDLGKFYTKILYRPFDERDIFSHPSIVWRTREEVARQMEMPNIAILVMRQVSLDEEYTHVFVTNKMCDNRVFLSAKGIALEIPLYIKDNESKQQFLLSSEQEKLDIEGTQHSLRNTTDKKVNFSQHFLAYIEKLFPRAHNKITSEEIFYYIYAVLYSNIYREKYQEFLRSDFPRIPFTKDYQTFQHLAELGEQLVELHLLKSKSLENPQSHYEGSGDDVVEHRNYLSNTKRLYINDTQYFDKVAPEVWNYSIGGYQVLDKWLKDRNGRVLSLGDQLHFRKIITALLETLDIQKRIDKIYPIVEKNL